MAANLFELTSRFARLLFKINNAHCYDGNLFSEAHTEWQNMKKKRWQKWMFLDNAETIIGLLCVLSCSPSFPSQSFVLRHLVIASVRNTKKLSKKWKSKKWQFVALHHLIYLSKYKGTYHKQLSTTFTILDLHLIRVLIGLFNFYNEHHAIDHKTRVAFVQFYMSKVGLVSLCYFLSS